MVLIDEKSYLLVNYIVLIAANILGTENIMLQLYTFFKTLFLKYR